MVKTYTSNDEMTEKRIRDKFSILGRTYGDIIYNIFAMLPDDIRPEFEAVISTGSDRDIQDIIIDYVIKKGMPFQSMEEKRVITQAVQDDSSSAAASAPDKYELEIRRYTENSLRNYAAAFESHRAPEQIDDIDIPIFKDKKEAINALQAAKQELDEAKKQFDTVLAAELKISTSLKSKASADEAQKLLQFYENGTVPQMIEANKYLRSRAMIVQEILNSEHIQSSISPEALSAEKFNVSWLRGKIDSPAALNKFVNIIQAEVKETITKCDESAKKFIQLKQEVKEAAETTQYNQILPILINQIPKAQHSSIVGKEVDSVKLSVFKAIEYLADNGSIKPVDQTARYKEKDFRIYESAERISEKLAKFSDSARQRILDKIVQEMVITANPLILFKVTMDPDRKRGFNHFMEIFNQICKAEEEVDPESILKNPQALNEEARQSVLEMCQTLDAEFNKTFENASLPRPDPAEIVKFVIKRVALNLVSSAAMQNLALGAAGAALNVSTPHLVNAIGPEAARLAISSGQAVVSTGKRIVELKNKGHSNKAAGAIAAAETAIDAGLLIFKLDEPARSIFRADLLSATDQFASELRKPDTLKLLDAVAENKAIETAQDNAVVAHAGAGAVAIYQKSDSKAPGKAAKDIFINKMLNFMLDPAIQKLPQVLQDNAEFRKSVREFFKPYVETVVGIVIDEAKARLGKALVSEEKAKVVEAAASEVPKIVEKAADHVSNAASAFIINQAGPNPAPLPKAAALAGIVAAGNIAVDAGVNPDVINAVANAAGRAAGLPIRDGEQRASQPASRRFSAAKIDEDESINPELANRARAIGDSPEVRRNVLPQKPDGEGLARPLPQSYKPKTKQRSNSF